MKLIIGLVFIGLFLLIIMSGWVICDGLMDQIDHVDLVMMPGHGEVSNAAPNPLLQARLDRAVQLYQQHDYTMIVVSGGTSEDGYDEAAIMAQYLIDHGLPGSAIAEDHQGTNTEAAVLHVAAYMDSSGANSVMVLAPYYRITRLKMALRHAGILKISQAHTGSFQNADVLPIAIAASEVYYHTAKYYLFPTAKTLARQLQDEAAKVQTQAADKMNSIDK